MSVRLRLMQVTLSWLLKSSSPDASRCNASAMGLSYLNETPETGGGSGLPVASVKEAS